MTNIQHSSSCFASQFFQDVLWLSARMRTGDIKGIAKNGEGGESNYKICLLDKYATYLEMKKPGNAGTTFLQKEKATKLSGKLRPSYQH